MRHRRLPIRLKLLGSAGLLIVLTIVVGLVAQAQLRNVADDGRRLYTTDFSGARLVADLERTLHEQEALAATASGAPARGALVTAIDDTRARIRDDLDALAALPSFDNAPELRAFERAWKRQDALLERGLAGGDTATLRGGRNAALGAAQDLGDAIAADARTRNAGVSDVYADSRLFLLLAGLLAAVLGIGIALLISRGIERSVADILDRLRSLGDHCVAGLRGGILDLARGDLTHEAAAPTRPIERITPDELGDVATTVNAIREDLAETVAAYNQTRQDLGGMIGTVAASAQTLSAASQQMAATSEDTGRAVGEIAHAVGDIANGAQRQVEALESARTVAEHVTTATVASAESAGEAAMVAATARATADEGTAVVARASEAMGAVREASVQASAAIRGLGEKSQRIGGIVDTITGIAEQTNLLALNAAIEAARAGDQGRGFAVVADEVRKLAEGSQQAAATIAVLIGEIQEETARAVAVVELGAERTEDGVTTVLQARESFASIGEAVEDMNARVEQIAAAVQQIAASSQQMQDDMLEVSAVAEESSASTEEVSASTEETSASTQQIAASAQELSRTAEELERLVGRFTLEPAAA
ncbi:MAG: methyl-accepting chemotaxis protein [Solirubrobacteraceae bacterium]|nr:methyl-accepting chemotaxis protein [Solirubrobacteraceae bacterium]